MRKTLVTVHLWLGLTIGLLWALQGFTGAMFAFSREADRLFLPTPGTGPLVSPDRMIAIARKAAPDATVTRLSVADQFQDIVNILYTDGAGVKRAIVVDGTTGAVIGRREMEPLTPFTGSAARWFYTVHLNLLLGDRGSTLIGISGLFLVGATITGLWVAWPSRGGWRGIFSWRRWRKLEHKLFGWHRMLGLMGGFLLIGTALTGAFLALPEEPVRQFSGRFMRYEQTFSAIMMHHVGGAQAADPETVIGAQQALDAAMKRFPHAHWVRIFMPTADMPVYIVRLYQPGEIRAWLGTTEVMVNAIDGQVVGVFDALHAPVSNKIFDGSFDYHSGALGGLPGRLLVVLLGFSLPALYITGIWAWLDKRRRQKERLARRSAAQPLASEPAIP